VHTGEAEALARGGSTLWREETPQHARARRRLWQRRRRGGGRRSTGFFRSLPPCFARARAGGARGQGSAHNLPAEPKGPAPRRWRRAHTTPAITALDPADALASIIQPRARAPAPVRQCARTAPCSSRASLLSARAAPRRHTLPADP